MEVITHKVGERVVIKNFTLVGRKPINEGMATLVSFIGKSNNPEYEDWMVRFDGETDLFPRTIY